jgi:hypothetical protein
MSRWLAVIGTGCSAPGTISHILSPRVSALRPSFFPPRNTIRTLSRPFT